MLQKMIVSGLAFAADMRLKPSCVGSFFNGSFSRRGRRLAAFSLLLVLLGRGVGLGANTVKSLSAQPAHPVTPPPSSISLTPAVIMLRAKAGQSTTQTLTVANQTTGKLGFDLKAYDVVVSGGKRSFVPAGETAGGIAQTVIFSPRSLIVGPGEAASVKITVTVPENPSVRAIVAIFEGQTLVSAQGGVGIVGSLGSLVTFNLSTQYHVDSLPLGLVNTGPPENLMLSESLTNDGSEPVVPKGTLAILGAEGALIGKVNVAPQRLLPGEQVDFKIAYPAALKPGKYRALISLKHEGGSITRSLDFVLP